jgi:DNA ligase 1
MQTDLLNAVAATTSRTEKEKLLAGAQGETKELLKLALDPMVTFGLTVPEYLAEREPKHQPRKGGPWWGQVFDLCGKLAQRELTGGLALTSVEVQLGCAPSYDDMLWAHRLINKDLRAGLGMATLIKVFPGLVTPFKVALAEPFDPDKHRLNGHYCLEAKLDGLRMVVIDGMAYTRNGHRITSVEHILQALPQGLRDSYVLDGEVMGADFDETSGSVRQQQSTKDHLVYNVFDMVLLSEWREQETKPLRVRKENLAWLSAQQLPGIKVVQWVELPEGEVAPGRLLKARDIYMKHGFEGAMVKDMNAPYQFKRSTAMLKVKKMETADGTIVGFEEGKGKCKGVLGALKVEVEGVVTSVGGGYSDSQREDFWKRRKDLIGRMMEVQYQNFTKDGRLRFPVFVRFRPDKE